MNHLLDLARLFVPRSKTSAGVRRIALDRPTVDRLRRRQEAQNRRRAHFGDRWKGTDDRVFDRGNGQPVSVRTAEEVMARHVERLGLPYATPHSLRHIHATYGLRAGVPLHVMQERLGHASAATTATIYAHALPADDRAAADAFAETVRPQVDILADPPRKTASD